MCIGFWSILPSYSFLNINDQAIIENPKKKKNYLAKEGLFQCFFFDNFNNVKDVGVNFSGGPSPEPSAMTYRKPLL